MATCTCEKCKGVRFIFVPCPVCSDPTDIWTAQQIALRMKCPECQECGGKGKVPMNCPDCNPVKSELSVELL